VGAARQQREVSQGEREPLALMSDDDVQVASLDEAKTHIVALRTRVTEVERRLRLVEKQLDTHGSPFYKRAWFRANGWPPWWVTDRPRAWRPWQAITDRIGWK
jgi:hypothetical protein